MPELLGGIVLTFVTGVIVGFLVAAATAAILDKGRARRLPAGSFGGGLSSSLFWGFDGVGFFLVGGVAGLIGWALFFLLTDPPEL